MSRLETDIAIVGAGLSGLALAQSLVSRGRAAVLLEARDRLGGRILSVPAAPTGHHRYDLGPAWIWPHNHRMLHLAKRLGLALIPQHAQGNLVFEDGAGAVRRHLTFATMGGALRVSGGLARVPEGLAATLPGGMVRLSHPVTTVVRTAGGVEVTGHSTHGPFHVVAKRLVLCVPPRVAAERIAFTPPLSNRAIGALRAVPTWMAAQGKVVAVYPRAFWRKAGLSGDAISHRGPLMEIHDASPTETAEPEAALFGFVHPGALPADPKDPKFRAGVLSQLAALFGPEAAKPNALHVKAWGQDPLTAVPRDRAELGGHPTFHPLDLPDADWRDRLLWSGTETAADQGGFLEGALEAAEATFWHLARLDGQPLETGAPSPEADG